jgi:hypothetical protein
VVSFLIFKTIVADLPNRTQKRLHLGLSVALLWVATSLTIFCVIWFFVVSLVLCQTWARTGPRWLKIGDFIFHADTNEKSEVWAPAPRI